MRKPGAAVVGDAGPASLDRKARSKSGSPCELVAARRPSGGRLVGAEDISSSWESGADQPAATRTASRY